MKVHCVCGVLSDRYPETRNEELLKVQAGSPNSVQAGVFADKYGYKEAFRILLPHIVQKVKGNARLLEGFSLATIIQIVQEAFDETRKLFNDFREKITKAVDVWPVPRDYDCRNAVVKVLNQYSKYPC